MIVDMEASNWLKKAFTDYKTVLKLLDDQDDQILTESVCFHSQQFAEKILKAFLISRRIDFKRSHDIVYLLSLCSEVECDFIQFQDMSKILSIYAVEIRYPDDYYIPSIEEAKCAFSHVEKLKSYIVKKLNLDEMDFYKTNRTK